MYFMDASQLEILYIYIHIHLIYLSHPPLNKYKIVANGLFYSITLGTWRYKQYQMSTAIICLSNDILFHNYLATN